MFNTGDKVKVIDPMFKKQFGKTYFVSHKPYQGSRIWSVKENIDDLFCKLYFGEHQIELVN